MSNYGKLENTGDLESGSSHGIMDDFIAMEPGLHNVICDAIAALGGIYDDSNQYCTLSYLRFRSISNRVPGHAWIRIRQTGYENKNILRRIFSATFGSEFDQDTVKKFKLSDLLGRMVAIRITEQSSAKQNFRRISDVMRAEGDLVYSLIASNVKISGWVFRSDDPAMLNYDKLPTAIKNNVDRKIAQRKAGKMIDLDPCMEPYICRKYVYCGEFKGQLWNRVPIFNLNNITADSKSSPIMKYFAKSQLRKRNVYNSEHIDVSYHAINQMSLRFIGRYIDDRNDNEGIVNYLQRLSTEALSNGTQLVDQLDGSSPIYEYKGIKYVLKELSDGKIRLVTIIPVNDKWL